MFELKNFDNWVEDIESGKFGSGASEKIWLVNPQTKEKGIFKFPKVKDKEKGIITGEYWAEKLATEIGKLIDVECARVDIGTYKGRIGSMSYNIIKENETLNEGVTYIQDKYPLYNKKKLIDEYMEKNKKLIDKAVDIMKQVNDSKHSSSHMEIVVKYTIEILRHEEKANKEVCIISAYWHDVDRSIQKKDHALLSANMLKEEMTKLQYDDEIIEQCYLAIYKHSWYDMPETLEGIIVRDADKIDFIGVGR